MKNKSIHSLQRLFAWIMCAAMLLPLLTPRMVEATEVEAAAAQTGQVVVEGVTGTNLVKIPGIDTTTAKMQLIPVAKDVKLVHHGRYVIMNSTKDYIMSYDAVSNIGMANPAQSLTWDQDGDSENTFYFANDDKTGNLFIDHSDRDTALWILRTYLQTDIINNLSAPYSSNRNYGTIGGTGYWDVSTAVKGEMVLGQKSAGSLIDSTGAQFYKGIEFQKGRYGRDDIPGTETYEGLYDNGKYATNGVYWYTPKVAAGSANAPDNQYSYMCISSPGSIFVNATENSEYASSASGNRPKFRMERFGYEKFLYYYRDDDNNYIFLYCDKYGNWGTRHYSSSGAIGTKPLSDISNDLADLTLRLYQYDPYNPVESGNRELTFEGYTSYYAMPGTSEAEVLEAIEKGTTLYQTATKTETDAETGTTTAFERKTQHIPCSGTTEKVGYYYLQRKDATEAGVAYEVDIYYMNDPTNDDTLSQTPTLIKTVKVYEADMPANTLPAVGIISKGSTWTDVIYKANTKTIIGDNNIAQTVYEATYTPVSIEVPGDVLHNVTAMMLYTQSNGNLVRLNTNVPGVYNDVQVYYDGVLVGTMTVVVSDTTIKPNMPVYPAPGSVRVDKGTTTTEADFLGTGVANIQLGATGKPSEKGLDLIVMLDLSSSMRYKVNETANACGVYYTKAFEKNSKWNETDWKNTRMYQMEEALKKLVENLQSTGANVRIAIADFGDLDHFEFKNAVIADDQQQIGLYGILSTIRFRYWTHFETYGGAYTGTGASGAYWSRQYEFPNQLNYVLSGASKTGENGSHVFHMNEWKYLDNETLEKVGVAEQMRSKMESHIYTGTYADGLANAFVDVDTLYRGRMDALIEDLRISNSFMLGTNYDIGLEIAYKMAYERRQQNLVDGDDRDIVCIFMSDGAAMQYNYFSGHAHFEEWNKYLNGDLINPDGTNGMTTVSYAWQVDNGSTNQVPDYDKLYYPIQDLMHHAHKALHNGGLKLPGSAEIKTCTCNQSNGAGFQAAYKTLTGRTLNWIELFQTIQNNLEMSIGIRNNPHKVWENNDSATSYKGDALIARLVETMRTPTQEGYYQTFSPYSYFYNQEGKNWWAEAMKGDVNKLYPVINMFAANCSTDATTGRPKTAAGTVNRSYYNGDVVNNFSGATTDGLALKGQEYISGFAGLGMDIYTIGFSLVADDKISANTQKSVLQKIATTKDYFYDANSGEALANAMLSIAKNSTTSARDAYYIDTLGDDYDLSVNKTVGSVTVNADPQIRVLDYTLDLNGNITTEYEVLECIKITGDKVAVHEGEETDLWDDTTNIITGDLVIYNANKKGVDVDLNGDGVLSLDDGDIVAGAKKIDLSKYGLDDVVLPAESFFWSIGAMPELTEPVLEYQVYLTGSIEGNCSQEWQYYDTNEEAILYFVDYRCNNSWLETKTPKMPWGSGPSSDVIVVDYGIPVEIDVMANDDRFKQNFPDVNTISAISKIDDISTIKAQDTELHTDFTTAGYTTTEGEELADKYGKFSYNNGKITYTLTTMAFDKEECLGYALKGGDKYYYGSVKILPATTLYYEDNFVDFYVYQYTSGTKDEPTEITATNSKYDELKWTSVEDVAGAAEENASLDQKEEYPFDELPDNVYGYDGAYTEMDKYSLGSAMMFTARQDGTLVTYGTAEFVFYGTGFDVISLSSSYTGTITVEVTGVGDDNKDVRETDVVDTYYGYQYVDSDKDGDKEWVAASAGTTALYQVPVIKMEGLQYGKYKAVITCSYNDFFNHDQYESKQYDFYLDAIRIYDPANDGEDNELIEDAYVADGEGWPEYFELRNLLISKNTFDSLNGTNNTVGGIVFIDGFKNLSDSSNTGSTDTGWSAQVSDYKNFGPNNELYLAPGQSIAFALDVPSTENHKVASIQIALKSLGGTAMASIVDAENPEKNYLPSMISSATDLYYKITDLNQKTVVITNVQNEDHDAILSITNVKITYDASHEDGYTDGFFAVSQDMVNTALIVAANKASNVGEEDPDEVINGTIDLVSASLSFEDEILTNLYYTVTDVEATEMGLLTWSSEPTEATIDNAENIYPGALYDAQNDRYLVQTAGIAAKNLGDEIFMCVYAKTENGIVYSDVTSYSPKQYALSRLEKSTNDRMKALCVAMLNYGAEAQIYFGYRTDDLMNASLTGEQNALVQAYDSGLFTGAVAADDAKIGAFSKTEGFGSKRASVSFEGAFAINYYFAANGTVADNVTFYYWNSTDYANAAVLTAENATGTCTMENGDGVYFAQLKGIAAKQLDDTYYVAAVYTDASGSTCCTGVIAYSLSKYCMNNANGDMGALAEATAMYGYYAEAYFCGEV